MQHTAPHHTPIGTDLASSGGVPGIHQWRPARHATRPRQSRDPYPRR